jgi:cytochrome c-type biogenesis protein CcmH
MSARFRLLCVLFATLIWQLSFAIDPLPFADLAEEKRFQKLVAELRCLQCQNQNLADSDATLAKDMRGRVFSLMRDGKSNDEIKQHMIDRFGEFVVYDPPFNASNAMLWITPFLALGLGLLFVLRHFGKRRPGLKHTSASSDDW